MVCKYMVYRYIYFDFFYRHGNFFSLYVGVVFVAMTFSLLES